MNDKYFNSILIKKSTPKDIRIIEKLIDKQEGKLPLWVSGPPGTGKTYTYIKEAYMKFLKKGIMWNRIVILSHTVNAAQEILKAVKNLPQVQNIPEDILEEQICTIHAYFKAESKKIEEKNTINKTTISFAQKTQQ